MAVLRSEFGIDVSSISHQPTATFNLHYVAESPDALHHVVARDLGPPGPRVDEIEEILGIEARLPGRSAALVRSVRRSRNNRHLEESLAGWISVRRHCGVACAGDAAVEDLVSVAIAHGTALDSRALRGFRQGASDLRYLPPPAACQWIRGWCRHRLAPWVSGAVLSEVERAIDRLEANPMTDPRRALRFVHGDLHYTNLVETESGLNVIDHECAHWDHPLYDLAQLLLSVCCSGYYAGRWDDDKARRFLAAARSGLGPGNGWQALCDTAVYVLLKQLALVRDRRDLLVEDRLLIVRALDRLRRAA